MALTNTSRVRPGNPQGQRKRMCTKSDHRRLGLWVSTDVGGSGRVRVFLGFCFKLPHLLCPHKSAGPETSGYFYFFASSTVHLSIRFLHVCCSTFTCFFRVHTLSSQSVSFLNVVCPHALPFNSSYFLSLKFNSSSCFKERKKFYWCNQ